jgi:hypothetical protein
MVLVITLMTEEVSSSETSANVYHTLWKIQKDGHLHNLREKLKYQAYLVKYEEFQIQDEGEPVNVDNDDNNTRENMWNTKDSVWYIINQSIR